MDLQGALLLIQRTFLFWSKVYGKNLVDFWLFERWFLIPKVQIFWFFRATAAEIFYPESAYWFGELRGGRAWSWPLWWYALCYFTRTLLAIMSPLSSLMKSFTVLWISVTCRLYVMGSRKIVVHWQGDWKTYERYWRGEIILKFKPLGYIVRGSS